MTMVEPAVAKVLTALGFVRVPEPLRWCLYSALPLRDSGAPRCLLTVEFGQFAANTGDRRDTFAIIVDRLYPFDLGLETAHPDAQDWLRDHVAPYGKRWSTREHGRICLKSPEGCDQWSCGTMIPNHQSGGSLKVRSVDAPEMAARWLAVERYWAEVAMRAIGEAT